MLNNSLITNANNQSVKNSTSCQMSSTNGPKSPSNLQNIKCESFSATSPNDDKSSKVQEIGEEQNTNLRECEIPSLSSIHIQKSNKFLNNSRAEVSPKNSCENQNTNNMGLKTEKLNKDLVEDINTEKTNIKRGTGTAKEDDSDKLIPDKICTKNVIAKENDDVLTGLGSIKKEEHLSPQLSPGGFDAIESGSIPGADNSIHGKFNDMTPQKNTSINNQKERLLGAIHSEESMSCNSINNNQINELSSQYLPTHNNSNFMQEFMQQQNHIFVFSTQLANKGAESVLNGHFPTIIAYHCMQPATKIFLEDFFIKNPMKVTKLQRQNNMNFPNASMQGNSTHWMNICNTKNSQKNNGNKNLSNPTLENSKANVSPSIRGGNNTTFSETPELLTNENEFLCWDPQHNVDGDTLKMLDGVNSLLRPQHSANKSIGFMETGNDNVPSLQGVKVPDENLTPQQRQHREEQLAKLKKMNQFLFPENGSDFKLDSSAGLVGTNVQSNKVTQEGVSNMLLCNQMNVQLNSVTQNSSSSILKQNTQVNCNSDNIPALNDDQTLSSEIIASQESGSKQNNLNKNLCTNNPTRNSMNRPCHSSNNVLTGNNISSSADLLNELNQNNINKCPSNKNVSLSSIQKNEDNQTSQLDWSKPQPFFDDRHKSKLLGDIPNTISASNSSSSNNNLRCTSHNNVINSPNISASNNNNRNVQGPPPPYHSTQRSASVPIAQSPNPSSPTNPTSNLSLPSPHTSIGPGNRENSPSLEAHNNLQTGSGITPITTSCNQSKSNFHPDGSPSNVNRSRSGFPQLNSNPSTPLSHMSPKEVDSYSNSLPDLKNIRPRPQTPRSPSLNTTQNSADTYNSDNRFNSGSPGASFCQPNIGASTSNNSYKPGSLERQNSTASNLQFGRRSENLPLNPNSSRVATSKTNTSFDPISSLAQMSQQLTNCSPHHPHVGQTTTGLNIGGINDMSLLSSNNPNLENTMNPSDTMIDSCAGNSNSVMGIMPSHGSAGPYVANNCHQMIGPMGQRMINPKLCGSFHPNGNNLRDGHGSIHHIGAGTRMGGNRMPMNFNNFNVSPNIQVKASTPNTIQYMPVRPQNSNTSLRPPPSLDFLQRYANPTMSMGVNMMEPGQIMQGNSGLTNEQHKLASGNPNGSQGLNFYQNCNQSGLMNLDQDELQHGAAGADLNLGPPLMRGARPMRQHPMPPRIQTMSNVNQQFGNVSQETLECPTDPTNIYNNLGENVIGQSQNFATNQQKALKNLCQSINTNSPNNSNTLPSPGVISNEHNVNIHSSLGNSSVIASNTAGSNVSGVSSINNNGNYKYLGPTANDIKYAQQYHSFQQQLYATSTRNQHGNPSNGIGTNPQQNPNFFVNK